MLCPYALLHFSCTLYLAYRLSRYIFCHMVGKCRRQVILQYFEEFDNVSTPHSGVCCDVCEMYATDDLQDFKQEMTTILQVVQEIPGNGEKRYYISHDTFT